MAIVGVIPAAGYATRMQPLNGSKEVYPVRGRPVMDYLVERMRTAGATEIRVVTRPEKTDVVEYAQRTGLAVVEGRPAAVTQSIALGVEGLAADDLVLIGFPDTIWDPPDGYLQLVPLLERGFDVAIGLFRSPDVARSDAVSFDDSGRVTRIEPKPLAPTTDWVWGIAVARAGALDGLADYTADLGFYFDSLCDAGRVGGAYLSDVWLDIGTREALSRVEDLAPEGRGHSAGERRGRSSRS